MSVCACVNVCVSFVPPHPVLLVTILLFQGRAYHISVQRLFTLFDERVD